MCDGILIFEFCSELPCLLLEQCDEVDVGCDIYEGLVSVKVLVSVVRLENSHYYCALKD